MIAGGRTGKIRHRHQYTAGRRISRAGRAVECQGAGIKAQPCRQRRTVGQCCRIAQDVTGIHIRKGTCRNGETERHICIHQLVCHVVLKHW